MPKQIRSTEPFLPFGMTTSASAILTLASALTRGRRREMARRLDPATGNDPALDGLAVSKGVAR
jgi:hypothetical protein